jgi:ABC-type Mn2+/Zn2+ transport system permease subunit
MSNNSSSKRKKIGIVPGVILCACQFIIAVLVLCSFSMATSGFRGHGITMGLLFGCGLTIFVFPVTLLIVMLLVNLQQKYRVSSNWIFGYMFCIICGFARRK